MRCAACLSVFALTLAVEDPMVLVNRVQLTQSGGGPPPGEFEYRYGDGDTVLLLCVSMDTRCTVQWLDYALYDMPRSGRVVSAVGAALSTTLRAPHHRTRLACHYVCPQAAPRTFTLKFIHATNFSDILKLTVNDLTMRPQAPRSHVKYTINYANNERLSFKCVTNRGDVILKAEHQGRQWEERKKTNTSNEMILLIDDMSSEDSIDDEGQAQLQYRATEATATADEPLYSIQIAFVKLPEAVTYNKIPTLNIAEDKILLKSYDHKENQQIFRGYKDGDSFRLSCLMSNKNDRVLDAKAIGTKNNVAKSIHLISENDYDIELRCVSAVTSHSGIDVPAPSHNVDVHTRHGVPAPETSGYIPTSTDSSGVQQRLPLPSSGDLSTTPRSEHDETSSSNSNPSIPTDDNDGAQRMQPWAVAVPAAAGAFCIFVVCAVVAACVMVKRTRRVQEGYGDSYYGDLQTDTDPSPRARPRVAPRLEPHYAAPVDQREDKAIYCEPWQPDDGPTTPRGRGSTPELNYAVLDISLSSDVAHNVVSEESPYAEVRHDRRASATVKTTEDY